LEARLENDAVLLFRVAEVFREVFDEPALVVDRATSPDQIRDWDSVAQVKLMLALEETFETQLDADDVLRCRSVGEVVDCLQKRRLPV
jgi:acyl carrier protein